MSSTAGERAMGATRVATAKVRDVGAYIREQRTAARMSLRHLAKLAGVSNPYLSQIERGLRAPSAQVLQAIAQGLRISAETLYVHAGILDARNDDLGEHILADPWLTEAQKRALLEIYRSFRAAPQAQRPGITAGQEFDAEREQEHEDDNEDDATGRQDARRGARPDR